MTEATRQLALPLEHATTFAGTPFIEAASNREALAWLASPERWPERRLLIRGEHGSGKTHLLQGWARARGLAVRSGAELRFPLAIEGGLVVDDADRAPETPLLHALNGAAEAGSAVLLSACSPAALWGTVLPDLASRLRATLAAELGAAEDELLRALLTRLALDRQMEIPDSVGDWLLPRLPRSPAALREAVGRLDRAALATGRAVTRALAARVVDDMVATWHSAS